MMSTKKYRIRLTTDEQQELNALVSRGRAAAYKHRASRWKEMASTPWGASYTSATAGPRASFNTRSC